MRHLSLAKISLFSYVIKVKGKKKKLFIDIFCIANSSIPETCFFIFQVLVLIAYIYIFFSPLYMLESLLSILCISSHPILSANRRYTDFCWWLRYLSFTKECVPGKMWGLNWDQVRTSKILHIHFWCFVSFP